MEIILKRTNRKPEFTIGELKVDVNFHSYILEDADRALHSGMSL